MKTATRTFAAFSLPVFSLLVMSALPLPALAADMTAEKFVAKAASSNLFEIDSSRLALERPVAAGTRDFARRMIDDHTRTGQRLAEVLKNAGSPIVPPKAMGEEHSKLMGKLSSAAPDDFEELYIKMQEDAHEEAVDLFEDYAGDGKDPALKSFAAETLPALRSHHEMARDLKAGS